jgi:hypothetical protein
MSRTVKESVHGDARKRGAYSHCNTCVSGMTGVAHCASDGAHGQRDREPRGQRRPKRAKLTKCATRAELCAAPFSVSFSNVWL